MLYFRIGHNDHKSINILTPNMITHSLTNETFISIFHDCISNKTQIVSKKYHSYTNNNNIIYSCVEFNLICILYPQSTTFYSLFPDLIKYIFVLYYAILKQNKQFLLLILIRNPNFKIMWMVLSMSKLVSHKIYI